MILEAAVLSVRAGRAEEFQLAFREAQRIIASMPGYLSHELGRCIERPDEFLLLTSDDTIPSTANTVDVSHRDTALSVSGPRAAWAINAFCALDLHDAAFPVGMCTRTLLGKTQVVLWRTAEATFRIEVARSLAPYVWAYLEEARREFLA